MGKLVLIDGNSVAFRAFYALYSSLDRFVNHDGLHTNAIYAFKNMLDKILADFKPTHVMVAFDAGKTTFRTEKFADYKGQRAKTPTELLEQLPYLRKLLEAYGIKYYELVNYEADDIIGTLAKQGQDAGYEVVIVTGDRDLTQLVTDKITVAVTQKGVSEIEEYTPQHVREKYGLEPQQIIDMKALVGDSSDNYPGVTKIGEKTAVKLLSQFGSVEGIYEHIDELKKSKMKDNLVAEQEIAYLCKDLATIRQDAPITIEVADLLLTRPDQNALVTLYQELDFKRFLEQLLGQTQLDLQTQEQLADIAYTLLTEENVFELIEDAKKTQKLSFHLEMDNDNYHTALFLGFAFEVGAKHYASRNCELLQNPAIKGLLEDPVIKIDLFDAKRTYVGLRRLDIQMQGLDFDLLLVSYLLDTSDNDNDLGKLALQHDYHQMPSDEEVYGKGAKRQIPVEDEIFLQHLVRKTNTIAQLKPSLQEKLRSNCQEDLYLTIERPLALVLAEMEIAGIKVDQERLLTMQEEFKQRLTQLEEDIYCQAGEEFNLNSPKQLGVILFEKLQLPVIKKTKTGYSTSVDVLEQLRPMAPIVDDILSYRQLAKLQSTYIEGLLKVIFKKDSKVHTRYTQTLTATGRLSSVDPNLQNIPIRLEEGRKIRQAFVASKPGWEIFASDYSQIELRVLAHISGDENMQQAFKNDLDIHANTAMSVFGLSDPTQVTADMRRQAKAVNFGIVYGISDFGLAQSIGTTRKKAKEFIQTYFEAFPGVHCYMQEIVAKAQEQGYVETIFKRRRYLPDINAKNFNLRSFAQRTAMNTPIQGSAADIIKVAMIKMQKALKKEGLQARMLLQVHDELIFEAPKEEIAILEQLVPKIMDSAVELAVPLKVESAHGLTWFDTK